MGFWQRHDAPDNFEDGAAVIPFVLKHVPELRRAQEEHRRELRVSADNHPTNVMTKHEINELTCGIYLASATLDVNRYREAREKGLKSVSRQEDSRLRGEQEHIQSVQDAQDCMQILDVVFCLPAIGGITMHKDTHWMASAVQEASSNKARIEALAPKKLILRSSTYWVCKRGMLSGKMLEHIKTTS